MRPNRLVSAVVFFLVIVGGYGVRFALRQASEDVSDRMTDRAVEAAYDWEGPDIDAGDVDLGSEADLPDGWPAALVLAEDLDVLYSTSDALGLNVTGNVDGEVADITAEIKADLEVAGFTAADALETETGGQQVATLTATGPDHTATVTVTETPTDPHGSLTVVYLLVPAT